MSTILNAGNVAERSEDVRMNH